MFELKRKFRVALILCLILFIVTVFGCQRDKEEKTTMNILESKEKITKDSKNKLSLSQLIDWKKEKIVNDMGTPYWGSAIAQNDTYFVFARSNGEIVRVNRKNGEQKILFRLKLLYENGIKITLTKEKMYYIYKNAIYRCELNGNSREKILEGEDIKKLPDEYAAEIWGIRIYDNQIYLQLCGLYVGKMNLKTKEFRLIAEDVRSEGVFCHNCFYYFNRNDPAIYKVDLKTLKQEMIMGQKWFSGVEDRDDVKRYKQLLVLHNELYYVVAGKEHTKFKQYNPHGKDRVIFQDDDFESDLLWYKLQMMSDYRPDEKVNFQKLRTQYLSPKKKNVVCPKNCAYEKIIMDDLLVYAPWTKSEEEAGYCMFFKVK